MRGKVAKALRREANIYAQQTGRLVNVVHTVDHGPRLIMLPSEELDPKTGKLQFRPVRFERLQDVIVDGPRFFLKALKRAYKKGLLKTVA